VSHALDGESDQQRDEERLQHVARRHRGEQCVRNDVGDKVHRAALGACLTGQFRALAGVARDVEPFARFDQVSDDQAYCQRKGRHHQEVADGQAAHFADRRCAQLADADHHGAEDDRGDHHLDQLDEQLTEHAQRLAGVGRHQAQHHAGDHADDDHDVEPVSAVAFRLGWLLVGRLGRAAFYLRHLWLPRVVHVG